MSTVPIPLPTEYGQTALQLSIRELIPVLPAVTVQPKRYLIPSSAPHGKAFQTRSIPELIAVPADIL